MQRRSSLVPDDFTPGISFGETDEVYHRREIGVASNSTLKLVDTQSLGHYLHYVRTGQAEDAEPVQDTEAQLIGRAFHCHVLEPERFENLYRALPDFGDMRSSKNRARKDEWLGYQPKGVTFLTPGQMLQVRAMRESLMRHRTARLMVERGHREVAFRWIDEETGLPCKAKADLWDEELRFFLDLKSCMSAHPDDFARTVTNFRYHVQHAMYAEGARVLDIPVDNFIFVPVEKTDPFFSAAYHVDAAAEEKGIEIMRRSLAKLHAAMVRWIEGEDLDEAFPAYGHDIRPLSLPGWAFSS